MDGTASISSYAVINLPVGALYPTEEINIEDARMLAMIIAQERRWNRPLLVETRYRVIMDGHHRYFCATALGLSLVPCVLLSYDDPNLRVSYRSDPTPVDVERIIQAGLSGRLMNYKTTRHQLLAALPSCSVPLDELK